MSRDDSDLVQYYGVLMKLAKRKSWERDLASTLQEITEAAAHTMGIERVNVWLFDEHHTNMRCIEHFERSPDKHSSGDILAAADYPVYFKALDEERTIVANDARVDPRTMEFTKDYLDAHGITSMLDAPIHAEGDVIGIICHEHVGQPRAWTTAEQMFAASLADLAALALESSERKQVELDLRRSEKRTRDIIANALDSIVIVNRDGLITDWNPRAEIVFGWSTEEAIGKTLYETIIPERFHNDHRKGYQHFLETGEGPILNQRIEITARDKTGREFPVELTISVIRSGDSLAFGAFIRDISDRVRAESEVSKLNAELEARVAERTTQLKAAVDEKARWIEELQSNSLELIDRLHEVELKSATIRSDLERARVIQRTLLPAHPPRLVGAHVNVLHRPGMNVSGDLYDVAILNDDQIALYVADAAGHGVAAAMLSVLFKQVLEMCDDDGSALSPAEALRRVNARLADDVRVQGLFITAGYVLINSQTGEMQAASAGHTPILLRRAGGEIVLLNRTGPALGLVADADFTEHHLTIHKGDRLMLYTDGLIDGLELASDDELLEVLAPFVSSDVQVASDTLREEFQKVERRGRENTIEGGRDDVTLLLFEVEDGVSSFDNDPIGDEVQRSSETTGATAPIWNLWLAEDEAETQLAIRGRGTWLHCEAFRRLAKKALDAGRLLRVDLADCTLLDSAFLGTLHEIVAHEVVAGGPEVTVHCPSQEVRRLFEELGLEHVLHSISEEGAQPPCEAVAVKQDLPARESAQRLLRAHEILSELSEENRERFSGVVEGLRAELGED